MTRSIRSGNIAEEKKGPRVDLNCSLDVEEMIYFEAISAGSNFWNILVAGEVNDTDK